MNYHGFYYGNIFHLSLLSRVLEWWYTKSNYYLYNIHHTHMNDPLKDNRIYPDEMQKETPKSEKKSSDLTWLWTLLIILALIFGAWFGYQYYQKNFNQNNLKEDLPITDEKLQLEAFNSLEQSAPTLEPAEREQRINTLFGN